MNRFRYLDATGKRLVVPLNVPLIGSVDGIPPVGCCRGFNKGDSERSERVPSHIGQGPYHLVFTTKTETNGHPTQPLKKFQFV